MIQANLPEKLVLYPERMYRGLVPDGSSFAVLTKMSRADLVICDSGAINIKKGENLSQFVKCVFEVKRGSATKAEIDHDLHRLHDFLKASADDVRGFLLVVSESGFPERFVREGKAKRGMGTIPNCRGYLRVRRIVKAASSFQKMRSAHYSCLIEVFRA